MLCSECGHRNLPDARFCVRCGSRVVPGGAPGEPAAPPSPPSPAEEEALAARELLAIGHGPQALVTARRAVTLDPEAMLPHLVLGEIYEETGELSAALRSYRAAAELAPDQPEPREKAEAVRRQIAHPHHPEPLPLTEQIKAFLGRIPRRLIPTIAGVTAGLLVFTVGAAAIISNTSPVLQTRRAFAQQMALGHKYYQAGQYAPAAQAFRQAQQLDPSSAEAMNRANDADRMAGGESPASAAPAPTPPVGDEARLAEASATPGYSAFPPNWVGPRVGAGPSPSVHGKLIAPPPIIPSPTTGHPAMPPGDNAPLPPPMPKSTTPLPPSGSRPAEPASPPGTPSAQDQSSRPKPHQGGLTMWFDKRPRPAAAAPPATSQPSAATGIRYQADQLRAAGRSAEAAAQYGAAAAQYRAEASRGGAGAEALAAAAATCEKAQRLCQSQAH